LPELVIDRTIPKPLVPLTKPARYKGVYGGRGSGKSHYFAEQLVEDHLTHMGLRSVCVREVQKSLKESAKRLIEDKIQQFGVGHLFSVLESEIRTPGGGLIIFQGMKDHSAESIKSLEGFGRCWIEEAQALSERSWTLLRPTIRAEGSEIWASWNPTRRIDPIDKFFRQEGRDVLAVELNWRDNPLFPSVLDAERLADEVANPDQYAHIWEGDYVSVMKGAYFASALRQAEIGGRIMDLEVDPMLPVYTFHDIGGAGAKADNYAIWVAQFIGQSIRWVDHYESRGQTLSYHANWLRERGYEQCHIVLPHDGVNTNNVTGKRYEDHWRDAGFGSVRAVPNQGAGAAKQRIEAGKRLFPRMWFDRKRTEAGRQALGFYHPRYDEARDIDLGPEHDWSSHSADAFGLGCIDYREPVEFDKPDALHPDLGLIA
jgi:phage terminase large subunit